MQTLRDTIDDLIDFNSKAERIFLNLEEDFDKEAHQLCSNYCVAVGEAKENIERIFDLVCFFADNEGVSDERIDATVHMKKLLYK